MGRADAVDHPLWEGEGIMPFQMVLEGGAMRNLFTCGVVDFLIDRRVFPESIVGTSAGAICGYNYASGTPGRMAYCDINYRHDWRFMSLRSKLLTGDYVGSRFIFDTIPNQIEHCPVDWFTESPIELVSVATDVQKAAPDYHLFVKNGSVKQGWDYLVASTSVPFANRAVKVDGKRLLDGGVTDSVPFALGRPKYRGRQIVVLTHRRGFHQWPAKGMRAAKVYYHRYPEFVKRYEDRPNVYNRQLEEISRLHDEGELFAIWPDTDLKIKMTESDTGKLFAAYEHGVEQAARQWPAIKHFLGI